VSPSGNDVVNITDDGNCLGELWAVKMIFCEVDVTLYVIEYSSLSPPLLLPSPPCRAVLLTYDADDDDSRTNPPLDSVRH